MYKKRIFKWNKIQSKSLCNSYADVILNGIEWDESTLLSQEKWQVFLYLSMAKWQLFCILRQNCKFFCIFNGRMASFFCIFRWQNGKWPIFKMKFCGANPTSSRRLLKQLSMTPPYLQSLSICPRPRHHHLTHLCRCCPYYKSDLYTITRAA